MNLYTSNKQKQQILRRKRKPYSSSYTVLYSEQKYVIF